MPGSARSARYEQVTFAFYVPPGFIPFKWKRLRADYGLGPVDINVCPNCELPDEVDDPWGFIWTNTDPDFHTCTVCECRIFGELTDETAYYRPTPGGFHVDDLPRTTVRGPSGCRADR